MDKPSNITEYRTREIWLTKDGLKPSKLFFGDFTTNNMVA